MTSRIAARIAALLVLAPLATSAFAQALLPNEGMLTADAVAPSGVDIRDDGTVVVQPSPVGLSGIPVAVVRFKAAGPIAHEADHIFRVRAKSDEPVLVSLVAVSDKGSEVYPVRRIDGGGEGKYARWSFDSRAGSAGNPTEFLLCVGSAKAGAPSVTLDDIAVDAAKNMADADVLAASLWRPLSLSHHMPRASENSVEAVASIPRALAKRVLGEKVVFRVDGKQVHEAVIDVADSGARALFQAKAQVALADKGDGEHSLEAAVVYTDGRELALDEQTFSLLPEERAFAQWEYAHQSIVDYECFMDGPDMRIVAILRDEFTIDEPRTGGTLSHEIHDTTVTLDQSMFDDKVAWRLPAYDEWGAQGFHSLSSGDWKMAIGMYVSAGNARGIDVLGFMSTLAYSDMTPSVKNPAWNPDDRFTGWTPDSTRTIRGTTIAPYGRGFAMLANVQVGNEPAKLVASVAPDLTNWADAGVVPAFLPEGTRHIDADWRDGIHYLYTDDATRLWVSRDPLRSWEEKRIDFPRDWSHFRVIVIDGKDCLFGLARAHGRNVLRWQHIDWAPDESETPLPKLKGKE